MTYVGDSVNDYPGWTLPRGRILLRALRNTAVFGVTTNVHFLPRVLKNETFAEGNATTALLAKSGLLGNICAQHGASQFVGVKV